MDRHVKREKTRVGDVVAIEDRRVRRRELSRERILTTALDVMDREGLASCTMQALATRLNVTPRALYRHVANKDDLLRGVADVVLSEMVLPDRSRPWEDRLRQTGLELRRVLAAHPHAVPLCARRASVFPAVIPITDTLIEAFQEAGLPAQTAIRFGHALFNYTLGFSLAEVDYELRARYEPPLTDPLVGVDSARVPHAAAQAEFFLTFSNDGLYASDEQYLFGLDLLIQGMATQAEAAAARSAPGQGDQSV